MPSLRDVISAACLGSRDWLLEALRVLAAPKKAQLPIINLDLEVPGGGWYASRSLLHTYNMQQLVLTYVDPDHVLDAMMFRKAVRLEAGEQELDLCWGSLAHFAEGCVRQQLLLAYERTAR